MNTSRRWFLSEYPRQQKHENEEEPSWKDMNMNKYHRQIDKVSDIEKSCQWPDKAGLKNSTEVLIMAAQQQALSTRSIKAGVYDTTEDSKYRLSKDAPETIST